MHLVFNKNVRERTVFIRLSLILNRAQVKFFVVHKTLRFFYTVNLAPAAPYSCIAPSTAQPRHNNDNGGCDKYTSHHLWVQKLPPYKMINSRQRLMQSTCPGWSCSWRAEVDTLKYLCLLLLGD